eukprot:CAMPEP_0117426118 /NCGR_PEP_ID=MMETSP0758-20121206/6284_1 /TAXON_ID=63605 /ORGANISM="Percolomonas cosmopolitus, Strain AE-1 (ATCC 50343)" /LENGTH=558 /DNA_ID=CAMNT_0005211071 /DNA_START=153 /DNA_END=1829 /DNA_ORIENTATION=+
MTKSLFEKLGKGKVNRKEDMEKLFNRVKHKYVDATGNLKQQFQAAADEAAQKLNNDTPFKRDRTFTKAGTTHKGFTMTHLDEYVSKPDDNYKWEVLPTVYEDVLYTVYFLKLTSQQWLTEKDVSRSIWWHQIAVIVPATLNYTNSGFMYITGSGNPGNPEDVKPQTDEDLLLGVVCSVEIGAIGSVLWHIPNERIEFYDEKPTPRSRGEDAIIAYTWEHYIQNPDAYDWPLRMPMTKGAVRAMDAVEEFVKQKRNAVITSWGIAGASKRGWTTWTVGAYDAAHDQRIFGIVPIVMSFINWNKNIHNWWRNMGAWSFALKDYYELNFTRQFDLPNTQKLADLVDPYTYRDRYEKLPFYQIMAAGDEFFQLEDPSFYWNGMAGEKHLMVVQNAEHALFTGLLDVIPGIVAYMRSFMEKKPRPQVSWSIDYNTNTITVKASKKPSSIVIWHSTTCQDKRVDFRLISGYKPCPWFEVKGLCAQPAIWFRTTKGLTQVDETTWTATQNLPLRGWKGFFVQLQYADESSGTPLNPLIFTTEAAVIPHTQPFPDCHGDSCQGFLT